MTDTQDQIDVQDDPVTDVRVTTMADLVTRAARLRGDHTALVDRVGSLSWRDLDAAVGRVAGLLASHGLHAGDRVAIRLPASVPFALSYFGAVRAGLVVVPVNPALSDREVRHVLADSGARAYVGDVEVSGDLVRLTAQDVVRAGLDRAVEPAVAVPVDVDDLSVLIYTSGTSGTPKGAMLSHRNMLANREQCARIDPPPMRSDDVVFIGVPAYHIYGLGPGLCQVAWSGATGLLVDEFRPVDTLQQMVQHSVTCVLGVPQMYAAWNACPADLQTQAFAAVRVASSGASPLPAVLLAAFKAAAGVTVWEGYGLTETSPVVTSTLVGGLSKPGSIGRPVPGVELLLLDSAGEPIAATPSTDEDEDFDDSPASDAGEISVRGANVFRGYWPDGSGGPDADGWFATGDIAYADDDGDLFLVDRTKELILVSGFNVYPREVELILDAVDGVKESAVIGGPDETTGETVRAYVVRASGSAGDALTEDSVIEAVRGDLARFKRPTAVEFVDELPHSATGKVRKAQLRADAELPATRPAAVADEAPPAQPGD